MSFGLRAWVGLRNHALDVVRIPHWNEQFLAERTRPDMPQDTLLWAVQKWLNRSTLPFRFSTRVGRMKPRQCDLMSSYFDHLLWPPCVADADIIFSSCGFFLSFFLSFFFFIPRLISAVADWMSTILPHMICGFSANFTLLQRCLTDTGDAAIQLASLLVTLSARLHQDRAPRAVCVRRSSSFLVKFRNSFLRTYGMGISPGPSVWQMSVNSLCPEY